MIYLHQHGGWQDLPGPCLESRSTCAKLPRNCAPGCSPPQGGRASPPPSSAAAHGADGAGGGHDLLLHLERSRPRSPPRRSRRCSHWDSSPSPLWQPASVLLQHDQSCHMDHGDLPHPDLFDVESAWSPLPPTRWPRRDKRRRGGTPLPASQLPPCFGQAHLQGYLHFLLGDWFIGGKLAGEA